MKDTYDGLNSLLKQVALEIATTVPEDFDIDVNVIYFPQLGFNIAIPLNDRGEAAFNGSDEDWELIFVTENRAYFKDFRMREMDEKLGDIYGLICGKKAIEFNFIATDYLQRKRLKSYMNWRSVYLLLSTCLSKRQKSAVNWTGNYPEQHGSTAYMFKSSCYDPGSELLQTRAPQDGTREYNQNQRWPVSLVSYTLMRANTPKPHPSGDDCPFICSE